jgi:hypothetical protein
LYTDRITDNHQPVLVPPLSSSSNLIDTAQNLDDNQEENSQDFTLNNLVVYRLKLSV